MLHRQKINNQIVNTIERSLNNLKPDKEFVLKYSKWMKSQNLKQISGTLEFFVKVENTWIKCFVPVKKNVLKWNELRIGGEN